MAGLGLSVLLIAGLRLLVVRQHAGSALVPQPRLRKGRAL